jgi:hypothetical protein
VPALVAPVVATPAAPAATIVQQPVVEQTATAHAPYLSPAYWATLCSGPLVISIEPRTRPGRRARYVAPKVVYASPLPCPVRPWWAASWRGAPNRAY